VQRVLSGPSVLSLLMSRYPPFASVRSVTLLHVRPHTPYTLLHGPLRFAVVASIQNCFLLTCLPSCSLAGFTARGVVRGQNP